MAFKAMADSGDWQTNRKEKSWRNLPCIHIIFDYNLLLILMEISWISSVFACQVLTLDSLDEWRPTGRSRVNSTWHPKAKTNEIPRRNLLRFQILQLEYISFILHLLGSHRSNLSWRWELISTNVRKEMCWRILESWISSLIFSHLPGVFHSSLCF